MRKQSAWIRITLAGEVGLFIAYNNLQGRGFEIPKETWRKRKWAALKAVELDETLNEAHVALAVINPTVWTGRAQRKKAFT